MTIAPAPADRFTFGLWTVGWPARDPFGDPTRAFEDFDADAAGAPGYGFVRLNQLAIEHLLRAR